MKKLLLSVCLLLAPYICAQEQKTGNQMGNRYQACQEYFIRGNYDICLSQTEELLAEQPDPNQGQTEHLRFMQAASAYQLNRMDASLLLRNFLNDYSLSTYAPKAFYYLGTCAMNAGQYSDALASFRLCNKNSLGKKDWEDYRFRLAYTYTQLGDFNKADSLFAGLLAENGRYVPQATYYMAYIDYCEGSTQEALEGFQKVVDHPDFQNATKLFILQLLFKEGQFSSVLQNAEDMMQGQTTETEMTELLRLSAGSYYELHNYDEALSLYNRYLKAQPELLRSDAYRIGMIHFMDQHYDKALKFFSKVTAEDDALAQNATFHIGVCYLQMQQTDMARMSFERASLSYHDMSTREDALYNYALLCYKTSFSPFNEQVKAFEQILQDYPNSRYSDEIYSHLADAFLSNSNYRAAIDFIEKIDHPSQNMLETKSKLLFLLGVERFNNADYEAAYQQFKACVDLSAKIGLSNPEAYFWKGETAYQLNNLTTAIGDFQRFLNAKGASGFKAWQIAHYDLAYCYFNTNNYEQALRWFEKYIGFRGISSQDTYIDALNRIGDCYYFARQYQQAEGYYAKTDRLSKEGNDYAVYQQSFCLGLRKQYKEKAALLKTFEQRFPSSDYLGKALFEEGRAYINLQQTDNAIAAFQRLMTACPNSELARKAGVQIGLLYYKNGQSTEAISAYKKVVSDYPASREAQTAVNDLKSIYVAINQVNQYVQYVKSLGEGFAIQADEQDSLSYQAAERLMMVNKQDEAIAAFKEYLEQFPQGAFYTSANYHCANLLYEKQRIDQAAAHFKNVLKQKGNPYMADALSMLADWSFAKENYQDALDYYQQLVLQTDSKKMRLQAKTGLMRCQANLENYPELLDIAREMLQEKNLTPELQRECRYCKCTALLMLQRQDDAVADWELLAKESQTAYGAEARYLLANYWFEKDNPDKALELAQAFLKEGTPHTYWMARCFILMADIYMQKGDDFQAKQYLLSLKENYHDQDDIQTLISARLQTIEERNNE